MDLISWETFLATIRRTSDRQFTDGDISAKQHLDEISLFELVDASLTDAGKERLQSMGIWWLIMQGIIREHWEEEQKMKCICAKCNK